MATLEYDQKHGQTIFQSKFKVFSPHKFVISFTYSSFISFDVKIISYKLVILIFYMGVYDYSIMDERLLRLL